MRQPVGEHGVPQIVLKPFAVQLLRRRPGRTIVAHLEIAHVRVVYYVLRKYIVVWPVGVVHDADERRIAALSRQRLAHLNRLPYHRRNGMMRNLLDQIRLLGPVNDVVYSDDVHVHGVRGARRKVVGRDLDAGEHQELARLLKLPLELGVGCKAHFGLAVPLPDHTLAEPLHVGLEAVGVHRLRRPALIFGVPKRNPLVRIVLEAVVVGDGNEVISRVLVGEDCLLRQRTPVRPERVHVQHATIPARSAAPFSGVSGRGKHRRRRGPPQELPARKRRPCFFHCTFHHASIISRNTRAFRHKATANSGNADSVVLL